MISTLLAFVRGIHQWITTEGFPSQSDSLVVFDARVIKLLNKQSICWYIKTPWCLFDVTVIRVIPLQLGSECNFWVHSGYGLCHWETILHCHPRSMFTTLTVHDDVIKWKRFRRYWPFARGIHRWIPLTKVSTAEHWCFLWSAPEQRVE